MRFVYPHRERRAHSRQQDMHWITRHYCAVRNRCRGSCPMSVSAVSCLTSEILTQLHVEYKISCNLGVPNQSVGVSIEIFESNPHIFHVHLDCIHPKRITILTVYFHRFFNALRYANSEFMRSRPIPRLTFFSILSRFFDTYGIHHAKAGSSWRSCLTAYSASSIG